jgi:hypothetical protein
MFILVVVVAAALIPGCRAEMPRLAGLTIALML